MGPPSDPAVADFLNLAGHFFTHNLSTPDGTTTPQGHRQRRDLLSSWTVQFGGLVDQLAPPSRPDEDGRGVAPAAGEEVRRACWKIGQDILIRLRRQEQQQQDPAAAGGGGGGGGEGGGGGDSSAAILTQTDIQVLRRRLRDIRERLGLTWQAATDSQSTAVAELSRALQDTQVTGSRLEAAERRAQDQPSLREEPPKAVALLGGVGRGHVSQGLLQDFILESLSFRSMNYREQGIAEAHGSSFEWVFNEHSVAGHSKAAGGMENLSFPRWLSTSELGNIYWITGKPGSGKSTLVRYLSMHSKTKRYLRKWAGDSELVVAGFYFWTSGSEEQRSQTGLLRSLLYQLLSSKPDLIAQAFPEKWQRLSSMTTRERVATSLEWTTPELIEAFRSFLDDEAQVAKICLFVDGLDEFDGDHETIIHFFRDLAEGRHAPRIKLCLSSRPWEVFEHAFEYKVPNLKLQASTFQDMMRYTIDRLSQNDNVRQVMLQDVDLARSIVQTTVERASGVFLWVRLAVRELLRRLDNDSAGVADMRDCVLGLPTDLDELFEVLVFRNQSGAQLAESSRLFRLVHARESVAGFIKDDSATSLSLWELAFAREGEADDLLVLQRPVQRETEDAVARRCLDTRDWAIRRSVGLLDVQSPPRGGNAFARPRFALDREAPEAMELTQHRVTYLHRTVRDWLMFSAGDHVWARLMRVDSAQGADPFDPHLRLLRSYVLQMKHPVEEPEHHRRLDEWYPGIALALSHARYVVYDPQSLQTRVINELEKTISWYWRSKGAGVNDHWARSCFGTYEERLGHKLVIPHPFLALCTKFGLRRYVLESVDMLAEQQQPESHPDQGEAVPGPQTDQTGPNGGQVEATPLLHQALEFLCSRKKTIYPLSTLSLVRGLLEYSHKYPSHSIVTPLIGSPNQVFSSTLLKRKEVTPWVMALRHVRDAKRRGWIEPFETDPAGTERWTSILRCLLLAGGADRGAIIKRDQWDPEVTAAGVLGSGGLLEEFGDFWVEDKLVPLLERKGP